MHAVYLFFNEADNLLYIGRTGNLPQRLAGHQGESPWYHQVASVTVHHFNTKGEACDVEAELIAKGQPRFNINHNCAVNPRGQWPQVVARVA